MGDFNAKVGRGKTGNIVGNFGLGIRNERGDRLVQYCQEKELVIKNTYYDLPPRRLYTWTSPRDNNEKIIRNQIDFITINKRFRDGIQSVKTYSSADADTDHNLLVANTNIKLRKLNKNNKPKHFKLNVKRINDHICKQQLNTEIGKATEGSTEWAEMKDAIIKAGKEVLGEDEKSTKKDWMTPEIVELINEKRIYKNKDQIQYKALKNKIKYKIKGAKEKWMEEQCQELEELNNKHDTSNLHKKLKELSGSNRRKRPLITRDNDGAIIIDENKTKEIWEQYIEELFDDERENEPDVSGEDTYLKILPSEVKHAIKTAKSGKASGPDEIPVELLKALDDNNIERFTHVLNHIYEKGNIPEEWLKSIFIPLPKNNNPKTCNDYRLISLMCHPLKILLKVIQNRIYKKCEEQLDETQFGFRGGMGTREALFAMTVLLQKSREYNKNVYICFIDFRKAFDRVQHRKLIEELKNINLDKKDIEIIKNIYWNQTAVVRVNETETNNIPIARGVRQGCVLSPTLFNVYSQVIFRKALCERKEGIRIGGETINTIRFADDTVIMAESMEELQALIDAVYTESTKMGLDINIDKTKLMIVSKRPTDDAQLTLNGKQIERVEKYKYLGVYINSELNPDQEIRIRIEMARVAFLKFKVMLSDKNLNIPLRLRFVECYVWSQLLYGVETWTLKAQTVKKIEAFELWIYRRMLRIPWTARITNEEVLRRMGRDRKLLRTIKIRKTAYLGHVLRNEKYSLLQVIIQGRVDGKKGIGRKRKSWLRNIREWTNMNATELLHAAKDRETFRNVVANLR